MGPADFCCFSIFLFGIKFFILLYSGEVKRNQVDGCVPAMPLVPEKNCGDNENNQNVDPVKTPETEMGEVKAKKEKEKAKDNLVKLASIVENESEDVPSEEDCAKYLQEMEMLKLQNEQLKLLGIIDTIINMTKEGKIVNQDINQKIPDAIVVSVPDGEQPTEYICSQVTKKWIMYHFQISENSNFSVDLKTKHLVQITDQSENTCDVMGLVIRHSSSFQRNRIFPEYYVKNEKLSPAPPSTVGDYSSFKGGFSTKKRTSVVKPHTPQAKVSIKLFFL